jgi:biotin transport system substrate-specific component
VLGSVVLAASAQFSVPMYPVPMTMQTLVVLLIGLSFGARLGAATVGLYLAEGLVLPVFEGLKTWAMVETTTGYLIGFVVAAAVVGWLADRGWSRSIVLSFAAAVIGGAIVYLLGVPWLAALKGWDIAITYGLAPFVIGDLVKAGLAALCLPAAWQLIGPKN